MQTNDLTGENILVASEVQPPLASGDIRDITQPYLTWSVGLKALVNKIGGHRQVVLRVGGCLELLFLFASEPQFSADSFDSMHASFYTMGGQIFLEAFRSIGLAGLPMRCTEPPVVTTQ